MRSHLAWLHFVPVAAALPGGEGGWSLFQIVLLAAGIWLAASLLFGLAWALCARNLRVEKAAPPREAAAATEPLEREPGPLLDPGTVIPR